MIELEGLEPSENPDQPTGDGVQAATTVKAISEGASMYDLLVHGIDYANPFDEDEGGLLRSNSYKDGDYVSDTKEGSAKKFNMYVDDRVTFNVDESYADRYTNYQAFIVGTLLRNFVTGTGPEIYNFPNNGVISSEFWNSANLREADVPFILEKKGKWIAGGSGPEEWNWWIYDSWIDGSI